MEAIEPAFAFPAAVATVERQEILVVEMHLDFVKVWLEINGFAETEVVRLGAGFFRKPRQVGLGIESAERTASTTPGIAGIDSLMVTIISTRWPKTHSSSSDITFPVGL